MINFIVLLCSLCIQFAAVEFPINYSIVNQNYSSLTDTLYNDIQNRGFSFDKKYMIVVGDVVQGNGGGYECFVPLEVLNGSNSSSSVTSRIVYSDNNISLGVSTPGWIRFKYGTSLNFLFGGYNEGSSNFTAQILNPNNSIPNYFTNGMLYNEYYVFDYQGVDSFTWDTPGNPVNNFDGHATGWSDLLIEDDNGNIYTLLGHSNGTLDNSNTIDLVDSSSSLTDKLLTVLINLSSGMNDNISFGLGSLISLFENGLDVVGLDRVSSLLEEFVDILQGSNTSVQNIENDLDSYIAYVSEPFDAGEFDIALQGSGFGNFSSLAHSIQTTLDVAGVDSSHVYITLDLSDVQYFSGFGSRTYDLATYLNGSKDVWQPLLLTFIYAGIFFGFFRSVPNIIGGASPVASSIEKGVNKNVK